MSQALDSAGGQVDQLKDLSRSRLLWSSRGVCHDLNSLSAASDANDSQLAASLVPALSTDLGSLDWHQLRMMHRHVLQPWAQRCPPELQPTWVIPICRCGFHVALGQVWDQVWGSVSIRSGHLALNYPAKQSLSGVEFMVNESSSLDRAVLPIMSVRLAADWANNSGVSPPQQAATDANNANEEVVTDALRR